MGSSLGLIPRFKLLFGQRPMLRAMALDEELGTLPK